MKCYSQQQKHPQPRESFSLPSYHGIGTAQISAANVVSYARVGSSQGTPMTSFSQPTTTYSSPYQQPYDDMPMNIPPDGGRSQARFHEFIARSRHLELLELLHDMKKRITYIEEVSVTNNNNIKDSLKDTKNYLEKETSRIMNLTVQANSAQNSIIGELRNKLDNFQINFERLERKLERLELSINRANENSELLLQHNEQPEVEGIPIEQYLQQGRINQSKNRKKNIKKLTETFAAPLITNNWTLEDDIFLGDCEMPLDIFRTHSNQTNSCNLRPQFTHNLLLKDNDSDVTEVDSYMTPPIHWV